MLYQKGRYSVEMGQDGAIRVRHGDWLSKYSAAMFNTFWRVHEFGRLGRSGMEPIQNINLIRAGEVIYHIPTYLKNKPPGTQSPPPAPVLSDSAKKELIKGAMSGEFHLRGDHLAILGKAIDIMGYTDNALSIAEVAGLIAEGGVASAIATGTSLASALLFPVGGMIELVNAWETGQRLAGMAAVAYTITAWAFDDPIPGLPPRLLPNLRASGLASEIPAYQKSWKDASNAALMKLTQMVTRKPGVSKKSFQVLFRATGDNNRQTLCRILLAKFENDVHGVEKDLLKGYEYPN